MKQIENMENMRFKVGDRVRIKSIDWYRKYANKDGIIVCGNYYFTQNMLKYCGKVLMITNVIRDFYVCEDINYQFSDEMIEGLVEDEALKQYEVPTGSIKIWDLPNGYQFKDENGNVINATKIVLEKKKKEYPKTYEECYCVLLERASVRNMFGYKADLMVALQKLLVCRNAYWKIAGEEMGLGKPWEPDWTTDDVKHSLVNVGNTIILSVECKVGRILAFPSKEMRDAFYENFKELINSCKELL